MEEKVIELGTEAVAEVVKKPKLAKVALIVIGGAAVTYGGIKLVKHAKAKKAAKKANAEADEKVETVEAEVVKED